MTRLRTLVGVLLASASAGSLIACRCKAGTSMDDTAACVDFRSVDRYAALTLAEGIDGIALQTSDDVRLTSIGVPCATASDQAFCQGRVAELLAESTLGWEVALSAFSATPEELEPLEWASSGLYDRAVITAGDEVRIASFKDLIAAVAPLTRDEAATLLQLRHGIDCGTPNVREDAKGWTFVRSSSSCSGASGETLSSITRSGEITISEYRELCGPNTGCIEGRRPPGLTGQNPEWLSSVASCLAEIAFMEAASVPAFEHLEVELRGLGAPAALLSRVRRARADEIGHARETAELARRHGAVLRAPEVSLSSAPVSALELALENAVEGCVREAYGALVAAHQARFAEDPRVRTIFGRIALDETAHAELSYDLDRWLAARLSLAERAEVAAAKERAWSELWLAAEVEPSPAVARELGMPDRARARVLLSALTGAEPLAA